MVVWSGFEPASIGYEPITSNLECFQTFRCSNNEREDHAYRRSSHMQPFTDFVDKISCRTNARGQIVDF